MLVSIEKKILNYKKELWLKITSGVQCIQEMLEMVLQSLYVHIPRVMRINLSFLRRFRLCKNSQKTIDFSQWMSTAKLRLCWDANEAFASLREWHSISGYFAS